MLCPRCRESDPLARPLSVVETRVMRFLQKSDCSSAKQLKVKPELLKKLGKVMWERVEYLSEREIKSVAWLDRMRGLARSTKGNGHPLP
jgi:recombinational DNA repair protein (RecF pathway)